MENNNLSGMIEAALMSVIANVILMVGNFVPFVGMLILALVPMPFIVIALRRQFKYCLSSVVVASLIALILMPFPISLMMPLYGGVVGIVMGYCMTKKMSASITILYTGIATTLSVFVILTVFQTIVGDTLSNILIQEYKTIRDTLLSTASSPELSESLTATYNDMEMILQSLFPALIITSVALTVTANYFASRAVLVRLRLPIQEIQPFSRYRYPNSMIYGVTFMLILSYISGYLNLVNQDLLLANLVILVLYLLLVQGLSLIYYWLEKLDIPKQIRIAIMVGLLIFQVGPILSLLGWIDSIVDFRAIHRKKFPKD